MSEISDLENRISAAMDRIGRGLEALSAADKRQDGGADAGAAAEDVERLQAALDDEKMAGAQLEERIKALTERAEALEADAKAAAEARDAAEAARAEAEAARDAAEAALAAARKAADEAAPAVSEEALNATREAMGQMAQRLRRMKRMSRDIRENNQKLRAAAEQGVSDPELINASLKAELESLKATREAELAEAGTILAGLTPLLGGTQADAQAEPEPMGDG